MSSRTTERSSSKLAYGLARLPESEGHVGPSRRIRQVVEGLYVYEEAWTVPVEFSTGRRERVALEAIRVSERTI